MQTLRKGISHLPASYDVATLLCDTPLVPAEAMAHWPAFRQVRVNRADSSWADIEERHHVLHTAGFSAREVIEMGGVDLEGDEHGNIMRGMNETISV